MFKRIIARFGLWVALLLGGVAVAAPGVLGTMNGRVDIDIRKPSARALSLHAQLAIADLHADSLLWPRDLSVRSSDGHVDVPRLLAGNVTLQVFSVVTKVPKGQNNLRNRGDTDVIELLAPASGWPAKTWNSPYERALYQSRQFQTLALESKGALVPIRSRADLKEFLSARAQGGLSVGGVLALEGAHMLDGKIERLNELYARGYRMIGLTHFFDNSVGGSNHGWDKGGLTPFGRGVIARMEELGIIVDLAHASKTLIDDVLRIAKRPVVVSHTGVRATCKSRRNLSDRQIDAIAANGGLIGIGFWSGAVCSAHPKSVAKAIRYVVNRVGIDHVALGSDFDGAVSTAFDTSQLAVMTDALLRAGFNENEVRAIMGENILRFVGAALP